MADIFEYVGVIYAKGVVTTIMGFADLDGAQKAFYQACEDNQADWAYLYTASGENLSHFAR